jgi:hypothetical protein
MSETATAQRICDICGAEVREGALFCYNCGGSVSAELPAIPRPDTVMQEIKAAGSQGAVENGVRGPGAVAPQQRKALSRAGRRRSQGRAQKGGAVVWSEPQGILWRYLVGAGVLVVLAAVLLVLAFYFR